MAKKVNKAAMIRQLVEKGLPNKEIVEALDSMGITVTPDYVKKVKYEKKRPVLKHLQDLYNIFYRHQDEWGPSCTQAEIINLQIIERFLSLQD